MSTELLAHCRQQLFSEGVADARAKPCVQRRGQDRSRDCLLDGGVYGPPPFAGIGNLADVAEVWRRGSVIASWLLDLTAASLVEDAALGKFAGRVSDSGEGRWTIKAAIDEAVPAPVLTTALYARFSSRGEADYQDKVLSAMRFQFGGHVEKAAGQ